MATNGMNKRLELAVRNAACTACKMSSNAEPEDVCVTGSGPNNARIMVVTRVPLAATGRTRIKLSEAFRTVGLDPDAMMWTSAIKCSTWGSEPTKTDQKACAPYLRSEMNHVDPDFVIAFGAEAWFAASGWADITKNRGKLFNIPGIEDGGVIFPTISPAAVDRSPALAGGWMADLHYFARLVRGEDTAATIPHHTNAGHRTYVDDVPGLKRALRAVRDAGVVSYDIETAGGSEPYMDGAVIVSIALTVAGTDMDDAHTYEIPLFHPESPFADIWRWVVRQIVRWMKHVPRRVAHNAKYDTKWLRWFSGDNELTPTFDTIIALSLLDENAPKGLKPSAQMRLGADPWGIDTKDLLTTPLADILVYNGLDTWHTLRLYFLLRDELMQRPRLRRVFQYVSMPLVQELIPTEMHGVYVHQDKLMTNWNAMRSQLETMDENLIRDWVPNTNPFIKTNRHGVVTHDGVNFNPSNFLRWFLFEHLGLPVLARGKSKDDGSPGDPSTAEAVMLELAELHPVPKMLLERSQLFKGCTGFFEPWSHQITDAGRIHSVFKPWGTVTGRLSSGKEDAEKITGAKNHRGVNLQQVPRNKLLRSVFGAPPGWLFVEADYSQVELRVAAFLAQEHTMLHLYNTGQDIHMATAMLMTGKPASAVTPEERKKAKAVNFGFLYGMGWRKFVSTAWLNYGVRVTEEEAQAFRTAFFDGFPGLVPWHAKQRRLARKYKRVETPMGRIRHLPDVDSPDEAVQHEAERQAINSPVQAFASDMAVLSLVSTSRWFRSAGVRAHTIGTIHDAVLFEVHRDDAPVVLPHIKATMENLPLDEMFGIHLTVPIVADLKIGSSWGGGTELTDRSLLDRPDALGNWIDEVMAA
jgi:uracil-DNA glycosylase family 4